MSIATQQAKERENRTPDVKVTVKTVKHGRLILQGSDIRGWVRISGGQYPEPCRFGAPRAGCLAWGPDVRPDDSRSHVGRKFSNWGRKLMISGAKFERFRGWKVGEIRGKLDLPATHKIRGSNPTKLHHTNKSQKKIGAIFDRSKGVPSFDEMMDIALMEVDLTIRLRTCEDVAP